MYTLEKNKISPLCILCTLVPQVIRLLTLMLVCMWYKESHPLGSQGRRRSIGSLRSMKYSGYCMPNCDRHWCFGGVGEVYVENGSNVSLTTLNCPVSVGYHLELRVAITFY
jgi:hypothetical protein